MKGMGVFILATVGLNTDKIFITTLCLVGMAVLIYKMTKDEQPRNN